MQDEAISLQTRCRVIYTPPIEQPDCLECYNHGTKKLLYSRT